MITTGGIFPQMSLGPFVFSILSAPYTEQGRETKWRWPKQDLFGQHPVYQFVGVDSDQMTLTGAIYPARAGFGTLDQLRMLAGYGQPLPLIDGMGRHHGLWIIESISEKNSEFVAMGAPLKTEFTLSLTHYDGGIYGNSVTFVSRTPQ